MPNINGVEIFSVGTWNGDKYTMQDLEQMVSNFDETKATIKPYLKLGHDNEQKFLQKEGIPSAGWINKLYVQGEKLLADFVDIPEKIYQLIQKKAYRKVSSEIFWNLRIKEKTYRRILSGVALLGAETPAVLNLNDILALYGLSEQENEGLEIKSYEYQEGNKMEKSEKEIALENELKTEKEKLAQLDEQVKKFQADLDTLKKENDILVSYKKETEAKEIESQKKQEELERKNFILELEKENLVTEAMKPLVESLLSEEKKEYCIKQNDKEQTYSKAQLVKETLKLFKSASKVNLEENSVEGEKQDVTDEQKIGAYMEEHKCTYAQAYKAVKRTQSEKDE